MSNLKRLVPVGGLCTLGMQRNRNDRLCQRPQKLQKRVCKGPGYFRIVLGSAYAEILPCVEALQAGHISAICEFRAGNAGPLVSAS